MCVSLGIGYSENTGRGGCREYSGAWLVSRGSVTVAVVGLVALIEGHVTESSTSVHSRESIDLSSLISMHELLL